MNRILSTHAKNMIIFKSIFWLWFIHEIHPSVRSFLYLRSPVATICQRNKAFHDLGPIHLSVLVSNPPPKYPIFWPQQTPQCFLGALSCLFMSVFLSVLQPQVQQQTPIQPSGSFQTHLPSEFPESDLCPTLSSP